MNVNHKLQTDILTIEVTEGAASVQALLSKMRVMNVNDVNVVLWILKITRGDASALNIAHIQVCHYIN